MASSNPGIEPRGEPPTDLTAFDDFQPWRVWALAPAFLEDKLPWKCIGAFLHLLEALDFIDVVHQHGADVIFQTPSEVTWRMANKARQVLSDIRTAKA